MATWCANLKCKLLLSFAEPVIRLVELIVQPDAHDVVDVADAIVSSEAIVQSKNTPEAIVQRLNKAIGQTLDTPSVRDHFTSIGEEVPAPERRGPEYLAKFVASEIERWRGQIRASGATID
jgi:tripartite-type tricarboxylate transporter receptor subunit TctC